MTVPDDGVPPLLSFPCHHEFKAIGPADDDFTERVAAAVRRVVPLADDQIRTRLSRGGIYIAVSVVVHLHDEEQLVHTYQQLRALPDLKYLL